MKNEVVLTLNDKYTKQVNVDVIFNLVKNELKNIINYDIEIEEHSVSYSYNDEAVVLKITSKEIKQVPIMHKDLRVILEIKIDEDNKNNVICASSYKYAGNGVNIGCFVIFPETKNIVSSYLNKDFK